MSDLTYGGTSGWSGTDTSRQRAESQDRDGTTGIVQRQVLSLVLSSMARGVTVAEVRLMLPGRHHGSISSALTNLHRAGRIARLAEQRERCKVYVNPMYVGERETEQPKGREPKVPGKPTACIYRSDDGQRWVVHVDTTEETGHVTVYVNDSGVAVFDQDPEARD